MTVVEQGDKDCAANDVADGRKEQKRHKRSGRDASAEDHRREHLGRAEDGVMKGPKPMVAVVSNTKTMRPIVSRLAAESHVASPISQPATTPESVTVHHGRPTSAPAGDPNALGSAMTMAMMSATNAAHQGGLRRRSHPRCARGHRGMHGCRAPGAPPSLSAP